MSKLILRGIVTRKLRTVLTSIAIVLGVAMIVGTYVLTDQIDRAFTGIFADANAGTDVVLTQKTEFTLEGGTGAGPLPASLIPEVKGIDGVGNAVGQIIASGSLVVDGEFVEAKGGAPNLVISDVPKPFDTSEYVAGTKPHAGEVAVDEKLADDQGLAVGDKVGFATDAGLEQVRVSGIFNVSNDGGFGGATLVVPTFDDAQRWFDRSGQTSTILASADEGVSDDELAKLVRAGVPNDVLVETGAENATRQSTELNDAIGGFLRPVLLSFAVVALLVGAFVIFNTFSITVAQRIRELALVRTLGASRRQVLRSVIGEALVIAVIASAVGVAVGYGFAKLLNVLFDSFGLGLPTATPQIVPRGIVYALIVGIGVTLVAALVPALRATRVPPIAALREGATLPPSRISRFVPYISGALIVIGVAVTVLSLASDAPATQQLIGLGVGALLMFFGMAGLARFIVGPLASGIGWPLERLAPASGRLARENAMRNPSRTAVTSAALMIGVGVVVFIAVFVNGIKTSFFGALDRSVTSDLIVESRNFTPIPARTITASRAVDGVDASAGAYFDQVKVNGTDGLASMNGVDPARIATVYNFDWVDGSDSVVKDLGAEGAVLEENFAKSKNLDVGDTFTITGTTGQSADLRVDGIYDDPQLFTGFMVGDTVFKEVSEQTNPFLVQVKFADGADPDTTQAAVEDALARFPSAQVQSNAQYKADIEDQLNQLLFLVYALLAMAVIISLFGIVNTLALSVFERTREIGMLRAIGTTRRQLRRMVRYESVITAIIGGILGIVIGVVFAWIVSQGLKDEGIAFAIPGTQLVVALVVAALAGVLAATLPARRAAKLNPLDALHYE